MLGEDHSLLAEFPEHKETISSLVSSDEAFLEKMKEYDALDKEIRKLELRDSPISDEELHQMKHNRAEMKDELYQQLQSA